MKRLALVLLFCLFSSSVYCADWPETVPEHATGLQEFTLSDDVYWSGRVWRECGSIYLFAEPAENREVKLYGHHFSIEQGITQFSALTDVCLKRSTSGSYECNTGTLTISAILKLTVDNPNFEPKKSFDLYYNNNQTPIEVPATILYYLDVKVDPPEAAEVDPNDIGYFEYGEEIYTYVAPNTGYRFVGWADAEDFSSNRVFEMPARNTTLTANFKTIQSLNSNDSGGGGSSSSDFGCFISNLR